jgi:glycopeptide antibiotics resistance protein
MTTARRRNEPAPSRARQWVALSLLAGYVVVVALATLTPTAFDDVLQPSLKEMLSALHGTGLPAWFGFSALEFSANILMFIPLAFALSLLMPFRLWWLPFLIGPALSIGIEVTQALLLAHRTPTVRDVIANSAGAVIGTLIAYWLRRVVRTRDRKIVALALSRIDA